VKRIRALAFLAMLVSGGASAGPPVMAESEQFYPEAMAAFQEALAGHGFYVTRIQHVDRGLQHRGFETGAYKVVFIAHPDMPALAAENPAFYATLPLTVLVEETPAGTAVFYRGDYGVIANMAQAWKGSLAVLEWEYKITEAIGVATK
jgi:uncharacterized protein (DUF302 family)